MLQTKPPLRSIFIHSSAEHVIFGDRGKECLILQKWQTVFCEIIIGMVWKGGVYKEEKKIPVEKKCRACHITMQHWFTALP